MRKLVGNILVNMALKRHHQFNAIGQRTPLPVGKLDLFMGIKAHIRVRSVKLHGEPFLFLASIFSPQSLADQ